LIDLAETVPRQLKALNFISTLQFLYFITK
jgi:hypothetical protein